MGCKVYEISFHKNVKMFYLENLFFHHGVPFNELPTKLEFYFTRILKFIDAKKLVTYFARFSVIANNQP